MPNRTRTFFNSIGRTFAGIGESVATARAVNELYNTPESVFRARGTTRNAAVRAIMNLH